MDPRTDAVTLPMDLDDSDLLTVEYEVPNADLDSDALAELERERYDAQIYAALVAPGY